MLPTPSSRTDVRGRLLRALDGVVYAVVTTAVTVGLGVVLSFPIGGGWTGVKVWLFLVGLLLFGLGTFFLRPRAAWKEGNSTIDELRSDSGTGGTLSAGLGGGDGPFEGLRASDDDDQGEKESPFQRLAIRFVPNRFVLPPDERWGNGARLFLTSLLVLGTSYAMEAYFGVGGGA